MVGYGFNSNGRYGQGGLIRERFAPRLLEADPKTLLDRGRRRISIRTRSGPTLMSNEKPGGHGERSVAVGTIDMAVWDAVAKIAGKPLFRLLAERHGRTADPRVFVYAAGGYYYPGKDLSALRGEMRGYLDRGYNVVKMKIGGAPIAGRPRAHRGGAEGNRQARRSSRSTPTAASIWRPRSPTPKCCATIRCSGTRKPAIPSISQLQAALAEFYPGADGDRREPVQPSGCAQPASATAACGPDRDWLQFDCALSYGLCEYQRTLGGAADPRLVGEPLHSAWRAPDVAQYRGRPRASAAMRAIPTCSSPMAVSRTAFASRMATSPCRICRASGSRKIGSLCGDEGAGVVSCLPGAREASATRHPRHRLRVRMLGMPE